jgi:hypothetical protein
MKAKTRRDTKNDKADRRVEYMLCPAGEVIVVKFRHILQISD